MLHLLWMPSKFVLVLFSFAEFLPVCVGLTLHSCLEHIRFIPLWFVGCVVVTTCIHFSRTAFTSHYRTTAAIMAIEC